jgi:hypothetical protein
MPDTIGVRTSLRALRHTMHTRQAENRLGATLVAPLNQVGATQRTGRQFASVHGRSIIVQWVWGFHGVLLLVETVCHKTPSCQVSSEFCGIAKIESGHEVLVEELELIGA